MEDEGAAGSNFLIYWLAGLVIVSAVILAVSYPLFDRFYQWTMVAFGLFLYLLKSYLLIQRRREEGEMPKDFASLLWLLGPGVWLEGGDLLRRRRPPY